MCGEGVVEKIDCVCDLSRSLKGIRGGGGGVVGTGLPSRY